MESIYEKAAELLREGAELAVAAVYESFGSTPRSVGAKMLISGDGSLFGTIGGGLTEATAAEHGREVLRGGRHKLLSIDMSGKNPAGAEMICGGGVRVMLCPVSASDLPVFEAICGAIASRRPVSYVIRAGENGFGHYCVLESGEVVGAGDVCEETKKAVLDYSAGAAMHGACDDSSFYVERVPIDGKVYIFGGGHVSVETAKIANIAGFDTVVIEDRAEFLDTSRFPGSGRVLVPAFDRLPALNIGREDYIIVVTRGHTHDLSCLKWALDTPAKYIGMIGSVTKRNLLYSKLMRDGLSRDRLSEVYSPIGIKIGGASPAEIAVSIVAELISVRSAKQKNDKA